MPKFSPLGKPLCIRCRRVATHKCPYRSFGEVRFVYYCSVHALLRNASALCEEVS